MAERDPCTPREYAYGQMIDALRREWHEVLNNRPLWMNKKGQVVALRAIAAEHNKMLKVSRLDGIELTAP